MVNGVPWPARCDSDPASCGPVAPTLFAREVCQFTAASAGGGGGERGTVPLKSGALDPAIVFGRILTGARRDDPDYADRLGRDFVVRHPRFVLEAASARLWTTRRN